MFRMADQVPSTMHKASLMLMLMLTPMPSTLALRHVLAAMLSNLPVVSQLTCINTYASQLLPLLHLSALTRLTRLPRLTPLPPLTSLCVVHQEVKWQRAAPQPIEQRSKMQPRTGPSSVHQSPSKKPTGHLRITWRKHYPNTSRDGDFVFSQLRSSSSA